MPRLRQVAPAEVSSARVLETYERQFGNSDPTVEPGSVGSWWTVFALDEELFEHMLDRQRWQFSDGRELPETLREIALARTGWVSESAFVYAQHRKLLARLDVAENKSAAIASWPLFDGWSDAERAVLAYTDGLVAARGRVDDATFEALHQHLSDHAILELTFIVCTYISSATLARALRLEHDDRDDPIAATPVTR